MTAESSSKSGAKGRRLSQLILTTNTLRETLSAFGDDVVKIKDANQLPSALEDAGGGRGVNPSSSRVLDQFDMLTSSQNQNQPMMMTFERVSSAEVGLRSSRWKKAIVAGLISSSGNKSKTAVRREGEARDILNVEGDRRGPFWGICPETRGKVSMLTLQLVLHEVACFASCILLGCLIVQAFDGISWIKEPKGMRNNWLFIRLYGSFSTALLVLTSIGYLLRIETTDKGALLTSPLYLIVTILLASSDYLNKAWQLEREECLNYFKMDPKSRSQVHVTQNCNSFNYFNNNNNNNNVNFNSSRIVNSLNNVPKDVDVVEIIMKIIPVVSCLIISIHLFCCRDTFYIVDRFRNKTTTTT